MVQNSDKLPEKGRNGKTDGMVQEKHGSGNYGAGKCRPGKKRKKVLPPADC